MPDDTKKKEQDFPVIVIGASAGGYPAVLKLMPHIPASTNAAIFIVLHISNTANVAYLLQHLQKHTSFQCRLPGNGESIQSGTAYLALPDIHLLISKQKIRFGKGPDENGFKPSIDALFRSAAVNYRERVTGIILSGLRDDGVSGMNAIKKCGGTCLVQDPAEAEFPSLPLAVIKNVETDHVVPVAKMGDMITEQVSSPGKKVQVPKEIADEVKIAERALSSINETSKLGTQSLFTCPDCGGSLWHIHDDIKRYRCFTGHAYTENMLLVKQNENIQSTLWVALRQLEERKKLLSQVPGADQASSLKKRQELEKHIKKLKQLLSDLYMISNSGNEDLEEDAA